MKKYKCTCVSGSGTEQESYWDVYIMPKAMRLRCFSIDSIWGSAEKGQELFVSLINKNKKHCLRIWEDDLSDFTIYPNQSGTPCHFEIKDKEYYDQAMQRIKEQTKQQTLI